MKSKINLINKRTAVNPARSWPFPSISDKKDAPSANQPFIDYVRGVVRRKEQDLAKKAYDQAKRVIDEQR